jgi:hypothetical protein
MMLQLGDLANGVEHHLDVILHDMGAQNMLFSNQRTGSKSLGTGDVSE